VRAPPPRRDDALTAPRRDRMASAAALGASTVQVCPTLQPLARPARRSLRPAGASSGLVLANDPGMTRTRTRRGESMLERFHRDETLQRLTEWIAIGVLVVVAAAAAIDILGPRVVAAAGAVLTAF
jgi:hypothetical protein